jgi:hypothetical protein
LSDKFSGQKLIFLSLEKSFPLFLLFSRRISKLTATFSLGKDFIFNQPLTQHSFNLHFQLMHSLFFDIDHFFSFNFHPLHHILFHFSKKSSQPLSASKLHVRIAIVSEKTFRIFRKFVKVDVTIIVNIDFLKKDGSPGAF